MENGKLLIIVAPSGAGKSTLIKRLKQDLSQKLVESISYTTRPMRQGEKEGVNYFYISKEEFIKMRDSGEFLEWAQVHTNFYGTSKSFVEGELQHGHNLIFDVDVQGTDSIKNCFKNRAIAIFIAPPSLKELEDRLRKRGTDSEEVIQIRLKNAKKEMERQNDFDYRLVNDDLEKTYKELKNIVSKILV